MVNITIESKIRTGEQISYDEVADLYVVEFVCEGNGRSSLAEAIANEQILLNHMPSIIALSSGINKDALVDSPLPYGSDGTIDLALALNIMEKAAKRGIYDTLQPTQVKYLDKIMRTCENENMSSESLLLDLITKYFMICRDYVIGLEDRFLARATKDLGLSIPKKKQRQQTRYSQNVNFFYGISEKVEDYGRKLYSHDENVLFGHFTLPNDVYPYDQFLRMAECMKCEVKEIISSM